MKSIYSSLLLALVSYAGIAAAHPWHQNQCPRIRYICTADDDFKPDMIQLVVNCNGTVTKTVIATYTVQSAYEGTRPATDLCRSNIP